MQPRARKSTPGGRTAGKPRGSVPAWGDALPSLSESAELKRASIVRAAAQCFNRSGFHGTSMDDIADRLGVTKAALYRYVSNKHELLYASFNMAMDSSFATLEAAERQNASGLEKLRVAVSGYLTELIGRLGHPVVLLEDKALRPEQQRAIIRRRDQAEQRYRALVEEGIRDGSIGPCNPKIAVFALMGAINWVPKWYRPDGELSAAEVVEALVDLITSGLATRTRPARAKERLAVAS